MRASMCPAVAQPSPEKTHRRRQQLDWGRCGVCLLPLLSKHSIYGGATGGDDAGARITAEPHHGAHRHLAGCHRPPRPRPDVARVEPVGAATGGARWRTHGPEGCLGRPVEAFGALLRLNWGCRAAGPALHEVRASATPLAGPFPGSPDRGRVSADQLQGMTDAAARVHRGSARISPGKGNENVI
jgi:hypothetical protein